MCIFALKRGKLEEELMMSLHLYELGPMIFGGTEKVIAFLRTNNLLVAFQHSLLLIFSASSR